MRRVAVVLLHLLPPLLRCFRRHFLPPPELVQVGLEHSVDEFHLLLASLC